MDEVRRWLDAPRLGTIECRTEEYESLPASSSLDSNPGSPEDEACLVPSGKGPNPCGDTGGVFCATSFGYNIEVGEGEADNCLPSVRVGPILRGIEEKDDCLFGIE